MNKKFHQLAFNPECKAFFTGFIPNTKFAVSLECSILMLIIKKNMKEKKSTYHSLNPLRCKMMRAKGKYGSRNESISWNFPFKSFPFKTF